MHEALVDRRSGSEAHQAESDITYLERSAAKRRDEFSFCLITHEQNDPTAANYHANSDEFSFSTYVGMSESA